MRSDEQVANDLALDCFAACARSGLIVGGSTGTPVVLFVVQTGAGARLVRATFETLPGPASDHLTGT